MHWGIVPSFNDDRCSCTKEGIQQGRKHVLSRQSMSCVSYFFQCYFHVLFQQLHYSLTRTHLCNLKELFLFVVDKSDASFFFFKCTMPGTHPVHRISQDKDKLVYFRPPRTNMLLRLMVSKSSPLFRLGSMYVETTIIFQNLPILTKEIFCWLSHLKWISQ